MMSINAEQGLTSDNLLERFKQLVAADQCKAKALLDEFNASRFSNIKEQDYIVLDKRLAELGYGRAAEHRGSSQEVGLVRKTPGIKKGRK